MANAEKSRRNARLFQLGVFFLFGVLISLVCGGLYFVKHYWEKTVAVHRVHDLALAVRQYRDTTGDHLPFVVSDENGEPLYSWRAVIMRAVDPNSKFTKFPSDFDFGEPWYEKQNRATVEDWLSTVGFTTWGGDYLCCLAVRGDDLPWNLSRFSEYEDFGGQPLYPIIIIEARQTDILWTEPRDLYYDGKRLYLIDGKGLKKEFDPRGCQAVRFDGSPAMFPQNFNEFSLQEFMMGIPG